MSNYFLEQVMTYLREGKITISFSRSGGEHCLYYIVINNVKTLKTYRFKVRKSDIDVIQFMIETEELNNAYGC